MDNKNIRRKINIIKGQLDGILAMIENNADCLEVFTQLKAAKNSFGALATDYVKANAQQCIDKRGKIQQKNLDTLISALAKY